MKTRITDFDFKFKGYGHYEVTYTSPITGKQWKKTTDNMPLIDKTKGEENPKIKDLIELKRLIKAKTYITH
jgi:hypothetical protein